MKILGIKFRKWDRLLFRSFSNILSSIVGAVAFVFLFWAPTTCLQRCWAVGIVAFIILSAFAWHWLRVSNRKTAIINVGRMKVFVGVGDIWKAEGLKVIAWNEFFDTQVDDKIIARRSLHGRYITNYESDINALDDDISRDSRLLSKIAEEGVRRPLGGKTTRYKLGTIFARGDYLMLAFTKFDSDNRAYLTLAAYVDCLASFWKELNIIYSMRSITIPLMGSGITRFVDSAGQSIPEQSLLRMMLWTLWQSNCKFAAPCKISIVLTEDALDKIDLLALEYSLMED